MAIRMTDEGCKNLRVAIVLQALKDYFHEPTKRDTDRRSFDKETIKKELASDYMSGITDGLSEVALMMLNKDEELLRQGIMKMKDQ